METTTHETNIKAEIKTLKAIGFNRRSDWSYYKTYGVGEKGVQYIQVSITTTSEFSVMIGKELIGYYKNIDTVKEICNLISKNTN